MFYLQKQFIKLNLIVKKFTFYKLIICNAIYMFLKKYINKLTLFYFILSSKYIYLLEYNRHKFIIIEWNRQFGMISLFHPNLLH
jgi:hypothetical protein